MARKSEREKTKEKYDIPQDQMINSASFFLLLLPAVFFFNLGWM